LFRINDFDVREGNNPRMRRLLLLLIAILLPLQSAVAGIVSVAGMPHGNCEQALSATGPIAVHGTVAAPDCCDDPVAAQASSHGPVHHCCHLGVAAIAMRWTALPVIYSRVSPVRTERALLDSIVLGVPSPPPTFLA
jgi:hypothetical protein